MLGLCRNQDGFLPQGGDIRAETGGVAVQRGTPGSDEFRWRDQLCKGPLKGGSGSIKKPRCWVE